VFPSAIREVVHEFSPSVSGNVLVKLKQNGVKQEPPLPLLIELSKGTAPSDQLAEDIRARLRAVLVVQTEISLVPIGTLPRSEYKSKLVSQ
jgi:phenylacetate-CoA ligase